MKKCALLPAIFPLLLLTAGSILLQGQTEPAPGESPHRILLQIERRASEQMIPGDRQWMTDRQPQIERTAAIFGYDLEQGSWSYRQAVCPLFPETMLLGYANNPGTPQANQFVAVASRGAGGVQVVPILRRGNTPFKSSYKNSNTISLFNRLLNREGVKIDDPSLGKDDRWVKLALCYAELSGEHPTTLLTDTLYGEAFERNVNIPVRRIQRDGSVVFEFSDVNDPRATVQWDLRFDRLGRLATVNRTPRPLNQPLRRLETQTDLIPAPKFR